MRLDSCLLCLILMSFRMIENSPSMVKLVQGLHRLKENVLKITNTHELNNLERAQIVYRLESILEKTRRYFKANRTDNKTIRFERLLDENFPNDDVTYVIDFVQFTKPDYQTINCLKRIVALSKNMKMIILFSKHLKNDWLIDKNNEDRTVIFIYGRRIHDVLNSIKTDYVFYVNGAHLHLNDVDLVANANKLLRTIKVSPYFGLVAPGLSQSGRLISECYQIKLKYYALKYAKVDPNDSLPVFGNAIKCDHVQNADVYLTRTDILRLFRDDLKLGTHQFYISLKNNHFFALLDDQINFVASDQFVNDVFFDRNLSVFEFMSNNEIELIEVRDELRRLTFKFESGECGPVGLDCHKSEYYALPRCCRRCLANSLVEIDRKCQENGINCEIDSGTIVGAVKFNHVLPWEIDGDVIYDISQHQSIKKSLQNSQLSYGAEIAPYNGHSSGFFKVYAGPFFIELFGIEQVNSLSLVQQGLVQTKVLVQDRWIGSKNSPGLYVRNRYGKNIYKHALSWRYLGLQDSFQGYSTLSTSNKCPKLGHHSCLAHLNNDGNVQFYDYV